MYLSRDAILGVKDRKIVEVEVPEWNGTVRIAEMSGTSRGQLEVKHSAMKDYSTIREYLLSLTLVDEEGKCLFTEKDIEALGQKNQDVIIRLYNEATKLNKIFSYGVDEEVKK